MSKAWRLSWIERFPGGAAFNLWRLKRGIWTGRWTEAEIADQKRRAHRMAQEMRAIMTFSELPGDPKF